MKKVSWKIIEKGFKNFSKRVLSIYSSFRFQELNEKILR
jgi:hypothetical protein